jgi:hypothetical protein
VPATTGAVTLASFTVPSGERWRLANIWLKVLRTIGETSTLAGEWTLFVNLTTSAIPNITFTEVSLPTAIGQSELNSPLKIDLVAGDSFSFGYFLRAGSTPANYSYEGAILVEARSA